jgi:hypothetical protein
MAIVNPPRRTGRPWVESPSSFIKHKTCPITAANRHFSVYVLRDDDSAGVVFVSWRGRRCVVAPFCP